MNTPEPATLGAVLILIGLALAFLAIYVLLNRRAGNPDESQGPLAASDSEAAPASADAQEHPLSATDREAAEAEGAVGLEGEESALEPEGGHGSDEPRQDETAASERVKPVAEPELIRLAELCREEVSGELVLRIGDREFRSAEEIDDDRDRRRIEFALADLAAWFPSLAKDHRSAARRRKSSRDPAKAKTKAGPSASKQAAPGSAPAKPKAADAPKNMIEGINAFLKDHLAREANGPRGVHLVSDASGAVRVLIGLKSYPMDEVPDEEIRNLIRQAVEEWEASQ